MIKNPKVISEDDLVIKALRKMEGSSITALIVPDAAGIPAGVIHLHDVIKSGVV